MKLIRICLRNFKKHRNTDVVMVPGITGLLGKNGVGKSTFLEGIYFGVTGETLWGETRLDILTWGQKEGHVVIEFEHEGTQFKLTRSINKGAATLEAEGKDKIVGIRQVNDEMAPILGAGAAYLRDLLFVAQEKLDAPLIGTDAFRKDAFGKLFGCSKFEKLRDVLQSYMVDKLALNPMCKDKASLEAVAQVYLDKLNRIDAITADIARQKGELSKYRQMEELLYISALPITTQRVAEIDRLNKELAVLEKELVKLEDIDIGTRQEIEHGLQHIKARIKLAETGICPTCNLEPKELSIDIKEERALYSELLSYLSDIEKKEDISSAVLTIKKQLKAYATLGEGTTEAEKIKAAKELSAVKAINEAVAAKERELIRLNAEAGYDAKKYETMEVAFKENEKKQAAIDTLTRIRNSFHKDGIQQHVRKFGANAINAGVNEFSAVFNIPYDVYFTDEGLLKFKESSGGEHDFFSLSGGEKKLVALAYRMALMRIFSGGLNLCVLDEPTAFIDKDNIEAMGEAFTALGSFAQKTGLTVFVATHEERLISMFNKIINI